MTSVVERKWQAEDAQRSQVNGALGRLFSSTPGVPYGFDAWDAVAGDIQPGEVDFLAAASGQGKTTAVRSLVERAVCRGVRVVLGGFEVSPEQQRMAFAAMLAGLNPGDVLSGEWAQWSPERYVSAVKEVEVMLTAMSRPPWDCLHLVAHGHVTAAAIHDIGNLAVSLESGAPFGVLCVVDHIDHLGPEGARNYYASVEVTSRLHAHAKKFGTRWLVTTQIHNRTAGAGGDRFHRHRDVQVAWIKNGQHKEEIATRIFGLYRPLRAGVTPAELKAVVDGGAEMRSVLAQGVSCVNCLKHRHHGERAGSRVLLGWERGRLTDLPMPDVIAIQASQHGIRTKRGLDLHEAPQLSAAM